MSSKSGSTLEPNVLKQYFFARVEARGRLRRRPGRASSPSPDPGSKLQSEAEHVNGSGHLAFRSAASIGGRYSVLSDFGMLPGAAM